MRADTNLAKTQELLDVQIVPRPHVNGKESEQIAYLATFTAMEYDKVREKAAQTLGLRVATLDAEVAKVREGNNSEGGGGLFEKLEPWGDPVSGSALLSALAEQYRTYLVLPEHAPVAAALWVLHTYAFKAADCSPIFCWQSPTPRCGKTTAETLTAALAHKAIMASNISAAALFRFIEACSPTLILDEGDTFLKDNEEMRGVLNAGHTRSGAFVIRCDGENNEPRKFSTWCPKSIALIGKLPATLQDRSVVVPMQRKLASVKIERLRNDATTFLPYRQQCLRWVTDHEAQLRASDPELPDGLNDRAGDNWRPLLAIADAAGGGWPRLAREAARAMSGSSTDSDGIREQLLADIREYIHFELIGEERRPRPKHLDRVTSAALAEHLASLEGKPWAEWKNGKPISTNQIARLLSAFDVIPKTIRTETGADGPTAKGYKADSFAEAFDRYLLPLDPPVQTVTPSQHGENRGCDVSAIRHSDDLLRFVDPSQRRKNKGCDAVTDQNPLPGGESTTEEIF